MGLSVDMPRFLRLLPLIAASALGAAAINVPPALASTSQDSIIQDDVHLMSDPAGTLQTFKSLGVTRVRVGMYWSHVAPSSSSTRRPNFNASDPGAYPAANWAVYDQIVQDAKADGISVYFILTGPTPVWATGPGLPSGTTGLFRQAWKPSAAQFGQFVHAVGTRYSGHYHGLPRVSFWSIWNEPNYGFDIAPQGTNHGTIETGAVIYRGLVDAAWSGLRQTGHGHDTILIGETAPRGLNTPGNFNGVKPLRFLRALYCVDSSYRPLRGSAASARGCPTTGSGSARFRSQHPGLFSASGYAVHPYPGNIGPASEPSRRPSAQEATPSSAATIPTSPTSRRSGRSSGSSTASTGSTARGRGSRSGTPNTATRRSRPSPARRINAATAAIYINWGEYLSWRQPRLRSYMQYLLVDPPGGNFASGLEFSNGTPKADYDAYRVPLFMPSTSGRRGRPLEVWGGARASRFGGSRSVAIQFQAGSRGSFQTLKVVPLSSNGYFDVRQAFTGSGTIRLVWSNSSGQTLHSRSQKISIH